MSQPLRREARDVDVRVTDEYPWAKAPPASAVAAAFRRSYGALRVRTVPYPLAPWCAPFYVFDRILGLPWASGGLGHSGGAHGPDEFFMAGVAAAMFTSGATAHGDSLTMQRCVVPGPVEAECAALGRSVAGDFVVFDPLGHADDGGVAGVRCRLLIQTFVGFLNNAGQPG